MHLRLLEAAAEAVCELGRVENEEDEAATSAKEPPLEKKNRR